MMISFNRVTPFIIATSAIFWLLLSLSNAVQAIQLTGPEDNTAPVKQVSPAVPSPVTPAPSITVPSPVAPAPASPVRATLSRGSQVYGPVTSKDTLWRIAFTNRQDKRQSVDQVMIAIFLANPNAFLDNNINLLKDGSMLLIPAARDIDSITNSQAQSKIESDSKNLSQAIKNIAPAATVVASVIPAKVLTQEVVRHSAPARPVEAVIEDNQPEQAVIEDGEQLDANNDGKLTTNNQNTNTAAVASTLPIEPRFNPQVKNLKKQLNLAMNDMQLLVDENKVLREQLAQLTNSIDKMKVQDQLDKQLQKDHQLLQDELALIEEQALNQQDSILNNGWFIAGISSIPSILILSAAVFWLSRRRQPIVEQVEEPTKEQRPVGEPDLSEEEGSIEDELNDDDLLITYDGGLLDDDLLDDDLLDDDIGDELLVPDDDIEEIRLDDSFEDSADDEAIVSSDDIDALLAEANALEDNNEDIVSSDDIDALLAEADALGESESDDNNDIVSSDDIFVTFFLRLSRILDKKVDKKVHKK